MAFLSTLSLRRATLRYLVPLTCPNTFLSTLSLRRATGPSRTSPCVVIFLSTLSLRRATSTSLPASRLRCHFYPRSPCGERRLCPGCLALLCQGLFLSTLSLRRATASSVVLSNAIKISIHALLAESDRIPRQPPSQNRISIHALLAESDNKFRQCRNDQNIFLSTLSLRRATSDRQRGPQHFGISIHALLAESDGGLYSHGLCDILFLSTLSLRRATASFNAAQPAAQNFYPRSPCGERLWCNYTLQNSRSISIHALLAESDIQWEGMRSLSEVFLSTLSLRRATNLLLMRC